MIRNTATLQISGIQLRMFSLQEGKELEAIISYDALM